MRRSILSRLKASYEHMAPDEQRESLISRFIYRPVSFYLTPPFVWLSCSANGVTLLRMPVAMVGTVLIATGTWSLVLLGSVIHALGMLLDYVDGNLARLNKTASILGQLLDGTAHIFERCLLPVGVAVGLCFRPDRLCTAYGLSIRLILPVGFLISMLGFSRTALSLLQLTTDQLGIRIGWHAPQSGLARPGLQFSSVPNEVGNFTSLQQAKNIMRRLLTEGAFFLDGIGIIVFAVFDLMSVFLIAVGIQNAFRLRDESQMLLDLFRMSRRTRHGG